MCSAGRGAAARDDTHTQYAGRESYLNQGGNDFSVTDLREQRKSGLISRETSVEKRVDNEVTMMAMICCSFA